jgi:hypothetical protein
MNATKTTESCEHHRIKRLCSKCHPRKPSPEPRPRVKGRSTHTTKDPETGEEVGWHFAMTAQGLEVRRKHCRKTSTKLFKFEALVSLLDYTFTARAQAPVSAAKPPEQPELFPSESQRPEPQLTLL